MIVLLIVLLISCCLAENIPLCSVGFERTGTTCTDINECHIRIPQACSQHCHNNQGAFTCSCNEGFVLVGDSNGGQTFCKADGPMLQMMVSFDNQILVTSDLKTFDSILLSELDESNHIYDFDYDYVNELIFWCSDDNKKYASGLHKTLWKASYVNGQVSNIEKVVEHIDCVSIAVDWVNEKVYWVTSGNSRQVVVSSYNGQNQISILLRDIGKPRAIAVAPGSGYIFWSDWGPVNPHIGRAHMDGTHQIFLVVASEGDDINQPTALTVDENTQKLYWMDAFYQSIHVMDYNGNSATLNRNNSYMENPWRMGVFEDRLYWTDNKSDSKLGSLDKRTGQDMKSFRWDAVDGVTGGLRMYHRVVQPYFPNPCLENECAHMCLLVPGGFQCKCDNGYKLLSDEKSCIATDNPCTVDSCDMLSCMLCGNGVCLLRQFLCDGTEDCSDGSDEIDCETTAHQLGDCIIGEEYECIGKLECISRKYVCDGVKDCYDGSDEEPIISCKGKNQCSVGDFVCDGDRCIMKENRCDGVDDCRDKTDEDGCDVPACNYTQFTCTRSRQCIDLENRCDGNLDCSDYSDEMNCKAMTPCFKTEFLCVNDDKCIEKTSQCDSVWDCTDGSDEEGCPKTSICTDLNKQCTRSNKCIPEQQFCNGIKECPEGEDEEGCGCDNADMVHCTGGSQCIEPHKMCDGKEDCDNGADESAGCCPLGYSRNDSYVCADLDECARHDGVCSQNCQNTEGSYICSCVTGYVLQESTKINGKPSKKSYCKAEGTMYMVITVQHNEPMYLENPDGKKAEEFLTINVGGLYKASENVIVDFDYDYRNKKMFWCAADNINIPYRRVIWVADLSDKLDSVQNTRPIVTHLECDSIAVDWINKLVYWTSTTNTIEVVDYEGLDRRAIIWTGLSKPRAIDLDPEEGVLFWTDWGDHAHLGRANMDGSDRKILIENTEKSPGQISWPNALTIDHPNKNVYWMDSFIQSIECMSYDATARYAIKSKSPQMGHPWRMKVFQDRVYWSDITNHPKISSVNKFSGDGYTTHTVAGHGFINLRIFHKVIQPMSPSRCNSSNCQHLCLPVPVYVETKGYRCACRTGHKLLYDEKTCMRTMTEYAFVAMNGMIVKVSLDNTPLEPTPQPIHFENTEYQQSTFFSLDYHNLWLYFNSVSNDNSQLTINRMLYDGSKSKVIVAKESKGGLSVDWLNAKIYWASYDTVSVGELDGSIHTTILQQEGFDFRNILVDPCSGYIYLSVWERGIYRVSMDGAKESFKQIIWFSSDEEIQPMGLTLDRDTDSLFFANLNTLYRVRLTSEPYEAEPIVTRNSTFKIMSADIWGDKVIWTENEQKETDVQEHRIMFMGKLGNSRNITAVREDLHQKPIGIKVYPPAQRNCATNNPCIEELCSHTCLQNVDSKGEKWYTCACPTGYALKTNSTTTCADEIEQYLVFNPTNGIQTVSLDTDFLTPIKEPSNMDFKVDFFDLDSSKNTVYYCYGNPSKFEVRKLFDDTIEPTSLPIHTIDTSGMAIEWITNKLYIVDKGSSPDAGLILVIDIDRPYLMKHIVTNIQQPLDIVVHPRLGKIYWISASHNILSTNMEGTDGLVALVSSDAAPATPDTQLFIDYTADSIYWIQNVFEDGIGDVGLINRVALSSKEVRTIVRMVHICISGVTLLNGDIYYTDNQGMLYRQDKTKGTALLKASDSAVFLRSSTTQYPLVNPCRVQNGGCSDFCLLDVGGGKRCACPTGIDLKDGLNCDTPFKRTLVVANSTRINMISLVNSDKAIDRVLTSDPRNLRSIDVDIRQNKIYWSEIHEDGQNGPSGSIWQLDMKTSEIKKIVGGSEIKQPNSIAIDWNAQNLYWVDSGDQGKGTLEVMSLKTGKRATLKTYKKLGDMRPHQVVLDPIEKYLFVSYPLPSDVVVTRTWLDGSNPFSIESDPDMSTKKRTQILHDLAIDIQNKKLYWSSSDNLPHISMSDYDGRNRRLINDLAMGNIQSISILNKSVFVQDTKQAQTMINVYSSSEDGRLFHKYTLQHLQGTIVSMKVSSISVLQTTSVSCTGSKQCSGMICIPTPIETTCLCADHDEQCKLDKDKPIVITNTVPTNYAVCPENYCNKNGACFQSGNNTTPYMCICDEGYHGDRCKRMQKSSRLNSILITVAVVVVLAVSLAVLYYRFGCKGQAKKARPYFITQLDDNSSESLTETDQMRVAPAVKQLRNIGRNGIGKSFAIKGYRLDNERSV